MVKEQMQVILIETFRGEKYVLKLDAEYEKPLMRLLRSLFKKAPLGSLAHISLRKIEEKDYNNLQASAAFMDSTKGIEDGKKEDKEEDK